jgi:autotransporter-associated beta strand protein
MNNRTQYSAARTAVKLSAGLMLGAALCGLSFATPALAANPVLSGDCLLSNPTGDNWTSLTSSSWATATNWSSGVPTSTTTQTNIDLTGPALITAPANAGTALNLCNGEVDLQTGGSLTAGAIAIAPGGTLVLSDSAATVTVTDAIYLNGGLLRATTTDTFSSKIVVGDADNPTGTISAATGKTLTLTGAITAGVSNADLIFGTPGDTGTGTVIYAPAAASTYAGNMTINYGTLQIGNGSAAGAITGDISNNATLAFDLANTSLYNGVISGHGNVQQNGTGNIFLSGVSTYTGTTTVNSGTLTVTGSIANSAVTVNSGGTLAGNGTVGATTVAGSTTTGGTTIPGGRIAVGGALTGGTQTLTIDGNLTLSPGSVYLASVAPVPSSPPNSPPPSSKLAVNGTATITGALLDISPNAQATAGVQYTLLTSTGLLTGTFSLGPNAAGNSVAIGNYLATLSYDAHDAYMQMALIQLTPKLLAADASATSNEQAVTGAIDHAINNGTTLTPGFSHLATSTTLAASADQLSGEIGGDLSNIVTAQMNPFLTVLMTQPGDLDAVLGPGRRHNATLWGTFFGGGGNTSADNSVGSHALSNHEFGFATGLDVMLASSFQMGAALAASRTNFTLASNLGTGTDNAYQAGLYLTKRFGRSAYISAAGAYSMGDITTTRKLTLPSNDTLSGKVTAHTAAGRIETGYRFGFGRMGLTPYVAFQYDRFNAPAYTETASAGTGQFALDYAAHTSPTTSYEIGTGIDYSSASSRRSSLHLYGRVAWAHATTSDPNVTEDFHTLVNTTTNSPFTVQGSAPPANSALLTFGAEMRGKNGLSIGFKLNGALSQSSTAYFGTGDLKYSW